MGRKKTKLLITDLRIGDMVVIDLSYNGKVTPPFKVVGIFADGLVHLDNDGGDIWEEDVKNLRRV